MSDYGELKVDELQKLLEERGLPKSGKKAELIARLEEHDAAEAESPAPSPQPPEEVSEEAPTRPRGSAETTAGRQRAAPRRAADGAVEVRAQARYVRTAPRKARLVIDHIRGKPVDEAIAILQHTPRAASRDVLKLLNSAIANAENNHELVADDLKVGRAVVDEGPTLKRFRPRALGRATRIRKRTSHMTITLTAKDS
jgi:ribosomal protein L22